VTSGRRLCLTRLKSLLTISLLALASSTEFCTTNKRIKKTVLLSASIYNPNRQQQQRYSGARDAGQPFSPHRRPRLQDRGDGTHVVIFKPPR
jgi:hypothetical protein